MSEKVSRKEIKALKFASLQENKKNNPIQHRSGIQPSSEQKGIILPKKDNFIAREKISERPIIDLSVSDLLDAPSSWNPFTRLKDSDDKGKTKFAELVESIKENGILSPLLVWKQKEGKYMIISGHNRRDALLQLQSKYTNEAGLLERFSKAPCRIYEEDELSDIKVKELILDSNYVQREENTQNSLYIIKRRLELLEESNPKKNRAENIAEICLSLNIKRSTVYDQLKIYKNLINELKEEYYTGNLGRRSALKLANLNKDDQEFLFAKFRDKLNESFLKTINFKKQISREELTSLFSREKAIIKKPVVTFKKVGDNQLAVKVNLTIPEEKREELEKLIESFQINN